MTWWCPFDKLGILDFWESKLLCFKFAQMRRWAPFFSKDLRMHVVLLECSGQRSSEQSGGLGDFGFLGVKASLLQACTNEALSAFFLERPQNVCGSAWMFRAAQRSSEQSGGLTHGGEGRLNPTYTHSFYFFEAFSATDNCTLQTCLHSH